ncbi:MAG: CPBP family intramembrane glutamic endopeptidase [Candidatus Thorarchaeota archaeon]|jgi:membrane protease YdiL (CAAX protease family)
MAPTQVQETTAEFESSVSTHRDKSSGLLKIGGIMLTIAVIWRIVDQFVLGLGSTWMNIFPSKLFPFLIIVGFFWKYRRHEISSILGLSRDKIHSRLAIGILIGLIFAIGIDFGGTIVFAIFVDPTYPLQLHIINQELLGYMFVFFLTNAFLEETLFRGLLINATKTRLSSNLSILLSAIIFGLWHAGWPLVNGAIGGEAVSGIASMVFFTFILGVFFGIYYERFSSSISLIGPIAIHTIINYVSECFKIGPEPIIQGPDIIFSNSGLMAVTFLMFFLTFIPLTMFLWKIKLEQVTDFWLRIIGKESDEEQEYYVV